MKPNKY